MQAAALLRHRPTLLVSAVAIKMVITGLPSLLSLIEDVQGDEEPNPKPYGTRMGSLDAALNYPLN